MERELKGKDIRGNRIFDTILDAKKVLVSPTVSLRVFWGRFPKIRSVSDVKQLGIERVLQGLWDTCRRGIRSVHPLSLLHIRIRMRGGSILAKEKFLIIGGGPKQESDRE